MSGLDQPGPSAISTAPTSFEPGFDTKSAGDVILVAMDDRADVGFYVRLTLLAELSHFFATLPPAAPSDLIDGTTPLIPLHDITHSGLSLLISAIQSIASPEPLRIPPSPTFSADILDATVAAKIYQFPIVYRILAEAVRLYRTPPTSHDYLVFAIWAIADVQSLLPNLARTTLNITQPRITQLNRLVADASRSHAPRAWMALQDLHLRHRDAVTTFHRNISAIPSFSSPINHSGCSDGDPGKAAITARTGMLLCFTVDDIFRLRANNFDLECSACAEMMGDRYMDIMAWLDRFAYDLNYGENA